MNEKAQDEELLRRIEREVRMREGAGKLLAACSQREQALEASKSLLTCNARTLALLSQLQKTRRAQILQRVGHRLSEDRVPCKGKLSLSDLRIPLMWKDSEYFKNKGELHRCAVFCLLQCGTEIHDTDLVMVDRTLTDICFEDTVVFNNVEPGFHLRVELYSSCVVDEFSPGPLGPRRAARLGGSLGCSSGKKIRAAFESAAVCGSVSGRGDVGGPGYLSPPLSPHLSKLGPKYNLLAHTTLRIKHVLDGFKTHDLSLSATEDSPYWLPLYGNVCCRLVAQPLCVTQPPISGQLEVKLGDDLDCRENVFAVLRGQSLLCYQSQDDLEEEPVLTVPIGQDTLVEKDGVDGRSVHITAQCEGEAETYTLTPHVPEDVQRWNEALWQHIVDITRATRADLRHLEQKAGHWGQCCQHLMKIEKQSPRKSMVTRQGSLYHEMVTPSAPREGLVVPDLSVEIRALLSSYYKERFEYSSSESQT